MKALEYLGVGGLKARENSTLPDVNSMPKHAKKHADVAAEAGEIVKFRGNGNAPGQIAHLNPRLSNNDDHGKGDSYLQNVESVLEDTSTKNKRNGWLDKGLVIDRDTAYELTGVPKNKLKSAQSHAELLKIGTEYYDNERSKYTKALEKITEEKYNDKHAIASAQMLMKFAKALPVKEQLYETIFQHQEDVKTQIQQEVQENPEMLKKMPLLAKTGDGKSYVARYGGHIPKLQVNNTEVTALAKLFADQSDPRSSSFIKDDQERSSKQLNLLVEEVVRRNPNKKFFVDGKVTDELYTIVDDLMDNEIFPLMDKHKLAAITQMDSDSRNGVPIITGNATSTLRSSGITGGRHSGYQVDDEGNVYDEQGNFVLANTPLKSAPDDLSYPYTYNQVTKLWTPYVPPIENATSTSSTVKASTPPLLPPNTLPDYLGIRNRALQQGQRYNPSTGRYESVQKVFDSLTNTFINPPTTRFDIASGMLVNEDGSPLEEPDLEKSRAYNKQVADAKLAAEAKSTTGTKPGVGDIPVKLSAPNPFPWVTLKDPTRAYSAYETLVGLSRGRMPEKVANARVFQTLPAQTINNYADRKTVIGQLNAATNKLPNDTAMAGVLYGIQGKGFQMLGNSSGKYQAQNLQSQTNFLNSNAIKLGQQSAYDAAAANQAWALTKASWNAHDTNKHRVLTNFINKEEKRNRDNLDFNVGISGQNPYVVAQTLSRLGYAVNPKDYWKYYELQAPGVQRADPFNVSANNSPIAYNTNGQPIYKTINGVKDIAHRDGTYTPIT